jgi:hypothetical protein
MTLRRSKPFWAGKPAGGGDAGYLDAYLGAYRAFSFKRVYSSYTGFCMRIWVSNTTNFLDVGFVDNELDYTAVSDFAAGLPAYILTWYDQSGSNLDYTGSVVNPPEIYTGTVFRTLNGANVARLSNNGFFNFDPDQYPTFLNMFYSFFNYDNITATRIYHSGNSGGVFGFVSAAGSGTTGIYSNYGTPSLYSNKNLMTVLTRGGVYNTYSPSACVVNEYGANISSWGTRDRRFGAGGQVNGSDFETGDFIEFIGTMTEANRFAITDLINNRYLFY